ncbi:lactadherin-like [Exaiptasia diaphana]|uniref:F5/8 type C domain-containing protein n=1 Tax=Exaiptasia diaphana TaxID=2652724 RepID=A0A913WZ12_EXADI|nr:lactadherin-like [Exaiptasia diaphana]
MDKDGVNYRCRSDCAAPLGMQDGRIADSQISASSVYPSSEVQPFNARLHLTVTGAGWSAAKTAVGEYLQIDLKKTHIISKVATQGRYTPGGLQYVKLYYLTYSHDDVQWTTFNYGGEMKKFQGNADMSTVVTHTLPVPIRTRFIRFVALEWYAWISMRVELYGCASN